MYLGHKTAIKPTSYFMVDYKTFWTPIAEHKIKVISNLSASHEDSHLACRSAKLFIQSYLALKRNAAWWDGRLAMARSSSSDY